MDQRSFEKAASPAANQRQLVRCVMEFEDAWAGKEPPRIEDFLARVPPAVQPDLLGDLIAIERERRQAAGETPDPADYLTRFPAHPRAVREGFSDSAVTESPTLPHTPKAAEGDTATGRAVDATTSLPGDSGESPTLAPDGELATLPPDAQIAGASQLETGDAAGSDARFGRYRVERLLGSGGFGQVYLAWDEQLQRRVAIKVATQVMGDDQQAEAYLVEARIVASLDHPHIVPVYDVGRTAEGQFFFVSKLVEGTDLAGQLKQQLPTPRVSAELSAAIADALHYAHGRGLVHRDIKPANILLQTDGRPYLTDFGIALGEQEYGRGARILAGTPAYMCPEQARSEGHLVDGRSDVYSLGVVLYQCLTGRTPFQGDRLELLMRIAEGHVRPPRQIDDSIPVELERICLKCLANRASDRYPTASDLAADLRAFLEGPSVQDEVTAARVMPKGLRSFDANDRDFYLKLLPGARNRDGLPDSLTLWKQRLEQRHADETFRVGLLCGPSGCGKSSLVRAGLIPRLAEHVRPVYIEATGEETESRLLTCLRKACPDLPTEASLKEAVAYLRRGKSIHGGRKVVLIVDQFEQWLHARHEYAGTELVDALRQCDGGNVQAVLMVRDDFWMAVIRVFRDLDIKLVEGHNSAAVDLFDRLHARNVLAEFGRAYGRLPDDSVPLDGPQERFLDDAITELSEEDKVVSVRLALFAEMVKGKPWTPETLQAVGGARGVGTNFLEETFSSRSAAPRHRLHQQAARGMLQALLPEDAAAIKGPMRARTELAAAAGYADRPDEFAELLEILDGELRLITPTDPEGRQAQDDAPQGDSPGDEAEASAERDGNYYQLTHDFLVPSLREWLTRKQRETRRGRAELRLGERAAAWNARPEPRLLPTPLEYAAIRTYTARRGWSEPQQKMMRAASRYYAVRAAVAAAVVLVLGLAGWEANGRFQARALTANLLSAQEDAVLPIVDQLRPYRRWARPLLASAQRDEATDAESRQARLHAQVAALPDQPELADELQGRLLDSATSFAYVGLLSQALGRAVPLDRLAADLRPVLHDPQRPAAERFRAGLALARYDAGAEPWTAEDRRFLVEQLLAANPEQQPLLRRQLAPIAQLLLDPLDELFRDSTLPESQQQAAANALAEFAREDATRLARASTVAQPAQYATLFPVFTANADDASRETLLALVRGQPPESLGSVDRVALGKTRAGAAITLLRQGAREEIFPVFHVTDDPESLTQFVHRCRERGVEPAELLECLERADTLRQPLTGDERLLADRVVFGLLLALGEYPVAAMPEARRESLVSQVADWYASDPNSGLHGASGWLLRHWGFDDLAKQVDETPLPYSRDRQWYVLEVKLPNAEAIPGCPDPLRSFYYTFIVVPPGEYIVGSPEDEPGRDSNEGRKTIHIDQPFAILDREITRAEYEAFGTRFPGYEVQVPTGAHAMVGPNWYDAVRFSRELTARAGLGEQEQAYVDPAEVDPRDYPRDPDPRAGQAPLNWPVRFGNRGFRLPSEAEWEIGCRAGTRSAYNFGGDSQLLSRYGWFETNSGERTHVPRGLRPNLWGLFDTSGNVHEWCNDKYVGGSVESSPELGSNRVGRGGSWLNRSRNCRAANRPRFRPALRLTYLGFRLASVPQPASQDSVAGRPRVPSERAEAEPER